jgi:hypothetical protein
MVTLDEESMKVVDEISQKKRKPSPNYDDIFIDGGTKRIKFQSFPKATSKLAVSAASATLPQDEDVEKRKLKKSKIIIVQKIIGKQSMKKIQKFLQSDILRPDSNIGKILMLRMVLNDLVEKSSTSAQNWSLYFIIGSNWWTN